MNVALSKIPQMPEQLLQTLLKHRVKNTRRLLELTALPNSRSRWLTRTGLQEDTIRTWIIMADLCRVPDITIEQAVEVAASGLADSVQSLGRVDPEKLAGQAVSDNGRDMRAVIARARSTPARLVWDAADVDRYHDIQQAYYQASKRSSNWRLQRLVVGGFAGISILIMLCIPIVMRWSLRARLPDSYAPFISELIDVWWLFVAGPALLFVIVLLVNGVSDILARLLRWFEHRVLKRLLAPDSTTQALFLAADRRDNSHLARVFRIYIAVWAAVGVILMLLLVAGAIPAQSDLGGLFTVVTVLMVAVIGYTVISDGLTLRSAMRSVPVISQPALMRYLILSLFGSVALLVNIAAAVYTITLGLDMQDALVEHQLIPAFEREVEDILPSLEALPDEGKGGLAVDPAAYVVQVRESMNPAIWRVARDATFMAGLRKMIATVVVWVLLTATIGYFLTPFLLTRRFGQAAAFIILTLGASFIEQRLSQFVQTVTGLPPGAVVTTVVLTMVILFNAAAFQTVEGSIDTDGELPGHHFQAKRLWGNVRRSINRMRGQQG